MSDKTIILYFVLFFFLQTILKAQDVAVMSLTETKHHFGSIKESNGPVNYNFVFRNTGKAPLVIQDVSVSCGCTTPEYTTDSIMPAQIGFIKVEYDPFNRPGPFNKSLTITTNAEPSVIVLFIEGNVIPEMKNLAKEFPLAIGNLRFKSHNINMGNISTKELIVKNIEVYNAGSEPVKFQNKFDAPPYIKFNFNPMLIPPGELGTIRVMYDVKFKNDLGYANDNVVLYTDEEMDDRKSLNVIAVIEEYFPEVTLSQLAETPRLRFEKVIHDFGIISKREISSTQFIFANNGKQDLHIRKITSNCNCVKAQSDSEVIKPGQSSSISITFDPSSRSGFEQKVITVFSNDPVGKTQKITVKATIKD
jgi:hypothetical protein